VKAVTHAAVSTDAASATAAERDWQYRHLPEHLRPLVFPAERLQLGNGGLPARLTAPGHDHVRALRSQRQRGLLADTAGAAADQDGLALHHLSPFSRRAWRSGS
jgi:hypothetical protein